MENYSFSQVPIADIPRSSFNRSHDHKTTFDSGFLIPFYVDEALPGDTFNVRASVFARLATPIVPIMDNMHMDIFYFAVPNRLVWDKWQRFMGERPNPEDSIDFLVPVLDIDVAHTVQVGSLYDYFGVQVGVNVGPYVSALFGRAYNLIWNEWFRDQNLQARVPFSTGDGPDPVAQYMPLRRGKRHDYFTSCLPWPQKGAGVQLPLGTSAPVVSTGSAIIFGQSLDTSTYSGMYPTVGAGPINLGVSDPPVGGNPWLGSALSFATASSGHMDTGLQADLTHATAATINSLRQAFQIQRLLERDARGGTRYVEILRSHFGVVSPDQRLQRPEFLGGGTVAVNVNPVAQTSSTDGTSPQGNLAAFGVAGGSGNGFTKSFVEHSIIIGMVMVRADLTYQQGVPRMFSRRTRYDFYWPSFAHLGEQAVLNREIYCDGGPADYTVFGYQERWAEYRYFPSKITGKFRSGVPGSLDVWHLAQYFTGGTPNLTATFIQENPPVSRVVAVTSEPQFLFDSHIRIKCARPMPTWSVPGLIDHF